MGAGNDPVGATVRAASNSIKTDFKKPTSIGFASGGLATVGKGVLAGVGDVVSEATGAKAAAEAAREQTQAMTDAMNRQAQDAKERAMHQESSATAAAARDAARQRQLAGGTGQGFGSTILTSPLGVVGNGQSGGGKTILGS